MNPEVIYADRFLHQEGPIAMTPDGLIAAVIRTATPDGLGMRVFRCQERLPQTVVSDLERALAAHGFLAMTAEGLSLGGQAAPAPTANRSMGGTEKPQSEGEQQG